MTIAFLVTTFNRPWLLKKCLDSISRLDDPRWEVLIADDHSSDPHTYQICKDFIRAHSQNRVFYLNTEIADEWREKTVRFSVNINVLAQHVWGDYMMYLTDDAEVLPPLCSEVHWFFDKQQVTSGYVGQVIIDADYITGERTSERAELRGNPQYGQPITKAFCVLDHSQVVHKREAFASWPVESQHWHHADGLFFDDLAARTGPIYPIGDPVHVPLVVYKVTESSVCRQSVEEHLRKLQGAWT